MNGDYLIDTNIVIGLFKNDESVVSNIQTATQIYIPSVVIGELFYGAFNSNNKQENIEKVNQFSQDVNVLNCNSTTGLFYGLIKKELKDKANPIPENDIWIAALAQQHNMPLVGRDKHFIIIKNIDVLRW